MFQSTVERFNKEIMHELTCEYFAINEQAKRIEQRKAELKQMIKEEMGDVREGVYSGYETKFNMITRTDLHKDKLKAHLGEETYSQFLKPITYEIMTIRKV